MSMPDRIWASQQSEPPADDPWGRWEIYEVHHPNEAEYIKISRVVAKLNAAFEMPGYADDVLNAVDAFIHQLEQAE